MHGSVDENDRVLEGFWDNVSRIEKEHIILYVADQERSCCFYTAVLGNESILHVPGMTEFRLPGVAVLGLMPEKGIKRLLGSGLPDPGRLLEQFDSYRAPSVNKAAWILEQDMKDKENGS